VDGGGGEAEASKQPLHGIICLLEGVLHDAQLAAPRLSRRLKLRQAAGWGALLWCRLKPLLHAALDTCQECPWVYVKSAGWSERVNTPQAGAAHQRPGDPGRRRAKELTLLIRIRHKGRRTRRGVSAGGRGDSVGRVVLGGSGLHKLLHGARSGSDKALPKSADTRRPRLVSRERKRHRRRPNPLPAKLAPATIKGAGQPPHYAQQMLAMLPPHYMRQIWRPRRQVQPRTRRTICASRRAVGHPAAPLTARHRPWLPACAPPAPKMREAWLRRLWKPQRWEFMYCLPPPHRWSLFVSLNGVCRRE
jgi:hypothetical protein